MKNLHKIGLTGLMVALVAAPSLAMPWENERKDLYKKVINLQQQNADLMDENLALITENVDIREQYIRCGCNNQEPFIASQASDWSVSEPDTQASESDVEDGNIEFLNY